MNEITTYQNQMALAESLAKSVMCPHKRAEDALFAIMIGDAMEIKPAIALQTIYNINGTSCMKADMKLALVKCHPDYAGCEIASTDSGCTVKMSRKVKDFVDTVTTSFTAEDALKAGLTTKDNYRKYPARMYKARAVGYACNDLFPDAMYGLATFEDIVDIDPAEKQDLKVENLFAKCREMLQTKELTEDDLLKYPDLIDAAEQSQDAYSIEQTYKQLKRKKDKQVLKVDAEIVDTVPADTQAPTQESQAKQAIITLLDEMIATGKSVVYIRNSVKKHLKVETEEKDWKAIVYSAPFEVEAYRAAYSHWKEELVKLQKVDNPSEGVI